MLAALYSEVRPHCGEKHDLVTSKLLEMETFNSRFVYSIEI
jgi:hypothetical protein